MTTATPVAAVTPSDTARPAQPWWNFSYVRLWRESWIYAGRERKTIIVYHIMFVFAIGFELATPYLLGQLVNTLQQAGDNLFYDCALYLGLIILCNFLMWTLHGPGRVLERRASQVVYVGYVTRMFERLTELPLAWHQDHHSGSTINRIRTAGLALKNFVANGFVSFQNVVTLAGAIGMLMWFNIAIGVASLISFILAMLCIIVLNRRMTEAIHETNEVTHGASATFFDFVSNMVSIIVLRLQSFSRDTLLSKLHLAMPPFMREVKINEWRYFIYTMLNVLMLGLILLGYIWFQLDSGQAIAAGTLVTVYLYQSRVGQQGFGLMSIHSTWLQTLADLRSTQGILDDHARLTGSELPAPPTGWQNIRLDHLRFTHRGDAAGGRPSTLQDVSLTLRRGENIALIGTSGAGKSTLLTLLRALRAPDSVETTIDGSPADFAQLAQVTTLIPQDPEVFENTMRFNVTFGLDVPDTDVFRALSLAEFMPVLAQLPQGLDTDIREKGVNLSVGQRQRLALARGIFAAEQSDIVLLDEPTSSVDLMTEEKIFKNLFTHFQGKTIIATLHRLHLLPMFDRILFLDQGRIVADMPTDMALTMGGPIRDIYNAYEQRKIKPEAEA
ncbi:MAG: ABC transporter ATP-binding protein [Bdellovibrionales bacterium]|jgi:ABC-type multidrug transport system fused ATPase/permease subunit|nr:ABC transporter ATP-binding protein [Bdellovibrionales bacterium]